VKKRGSSFRLVGQCASGQLVYAGVYSFYETYGLPLSIMLGLMWDKNMVPDWVELIAEAVRAGRPRERAIGWVIAAAHDAAYPKDVEGFIVSRLEKLLE